MNRISFLSVLVPVYNEEECIDVLHQRLSAVLDKFDFKSEILFVNDGSTDNTVMCITELQKKDPRVAYLDLSRNYGKEIAMAAGIDYIRGDALVIIDADLQDPPELMEEMVKGIEEGYDDVYAKRMSRDGESFFKKFTSKQYYRWLKRISDIPIQEDTGDYRMFSKKAIDGLKKLKESERNMKGLFSYIGFRKKPILYNRDPRVAGETKWNYQKLTGLAIKGLTSFSTTPLRLVSIMGIIISFSAFIYMLITVIKAIIWGNSVDGYPSLMSVILFLGGIQLLALGVIGEYIGIIYNETKKRPMYYINEYISGDKETV